MGNLCPNETLLEPDYTETWHLGNTNFSYSNFRNSTNEFEEVCFQKLLKHYWKNEDLDTPVSRSQTEVTFNSQLFTRIKPRLSGGIPNYLFRKVLTKVFVFDENRSMDTYNELVDSSAVKFAYSSCFFGKEPLENLCLTQEGSEAVVRLLKIIKLRFPDLDYCPILPVVTQILLWFLHEHEVYQIVWFLIASSKEDLSSHFLTLKTTHLEAVNAISSRTAKVFKGYVQNEAELKYVVFDAFTNMLTGYISPSYYPFVVSVWLCKGVKGLMSLTCSFVYCSVVQMKNYLKNSTSSKELTESWKLISKNSIEVSEFIKTFKVLKFSK